ILYAEVESIVALYQHDQTLLQRMHTFRSEYYRRFVLRASGPVRDLLWTNVLTVGVTGDGLVSVAPSPRPLHVGGRCSASAVLRIGVVEPAPGVPRRALVSVRGHAAGVLQHPGEVEQ